MAEMTVPRWLERGYSDIVSATTTGETIEVHFGNGDVIVLPASSLGLGTATRVEVDPDEALSISIVTEDGASVEISSTRLRSATDPDYAQELRRRDTEEARRLGRRLKALREDRNLSQRDLAQLVSMPPPQLAKIENGTYDLRVSTVQTLLRAMDATFSDIAGPDVPELSQKTIRRNVERAGVPRDVIDRIIRLVDRRRLLDTIAEAFGWTRDALVNGTAVAQPLPVPVRLKVKAGKTQAASPLLALAYNVSAEVLDALRVSVVRSLPTTPSEIRAVVADKSGRITLESLLKWCWGVGIAVLPLHGSGGFSAAAWNMKGAPIVVIKEGRDFAIYWLFDLAHEVAHIVLGHIEGTAVVDVETSAALRESSDEQEQSATRFALNLLLPNRNDLLKLVRADARGSHLRFKGAVERVAARHRISPALLGMVAAYELEEVGEYKDRWGSASNLARPEGSGRALTETFLRRNLRPDRLDAHAHILTRAVVFNDKRANHEGK